MNEKTWRLAVPTAAFYDLLCGPLGGRMPCAHHVENLPAGMMDHVDHVQRLNVMVWTQKKSHARTVDACCITDNGRGACTQDETHIAWLGQVSVFAAYGCASVGRAAGSGSASPLVAETEFMPCCHCRALAVIRVDVACAWPRGRGAAVGRNSPGWVAERDANVEWGRALV
jgi:hypothetical protein